VTHRVIDKPHYLLLTTSSDLTEPGEVYWAMEGVFDSDTAAITALLARHSHGITGSRIVEVTLPKAVLPATLKQIKGRVMEFADEESGD
jgi:hypothetical protein